MVDLLTGEATGASQSTLELEGNNPAAVALGPMGGLKGGKARARALSARKRSEITRKAAAKRWAQKTK
jgi:hypothetical protein